MPILDMSVEDLKQYQGINPRPADFDAYWEKALAEMNATDPKVELVPAAFQTPQAECFDLYFTGVRGARIHALYLRPRQSAGPHPAVLQFHGYSCSAGCFSEKLSFVSLGYSVAALDCRGQGGISEDVGGVQGNTLHGHIIRGLDDKDPQNLLFRHIFLDTAELAKIVMSFDEVDENRVAAMGGSQGGGLTLACASLVPSIKMAAPMYPFLCDYRRVWEMDLAKDAFAELTEYFRHVDPTHAREDEVFERLGYIDVQNLTPRIRGEVMMGTGLMDNIVPPSTQFAAYNKITSKKSVVIYPDFGHEDLPGFSDRTVMMFQGL